MTRYCAVGWCGKTVYYSTFTESEAYQMAYDEFDGNIYDFYEE
jgi:hypothetical protein